ncbi:DnaB-like helicase N-terminal domain-containing protein [Streptomyces sp. N35]|uniref:DnaB-like helicase N-terminal domain-containing protein n=1 Tax=Streptomyces sp. N35 TaxID=2795730 RepID=UPI0018F4D846|nr:DnaB-like helicase N-terminal domain-containing protein [Streptomyces sp. N35]
MTKTLVGHPEPPSQHADPHAERTVLGALLCYPATAAVLLVSLDSEDFAAAEHKAVFRAAQGLLDQGRPIDPITVTQHLQYSAREIVAPAELVHALVATAPIQALALTYSTIVSTLGRLRRQEKPGDGPAAGPGPLHPQGPEGLPPVPMRGFLIDED